MAQKNKLLGKEDDIINLFKTGQYEFKQLAKLYNVSPVSIRHMLNKKGYFAKSFNEISRKYNIDQNYFDNLNHQDKFYILGLFTADACNIPKNNKVLICLKTEDGYLLENLKNCLKFNKPLYKIEPKSFIQNGKNYQTSGHYKLVIISKKISERLLELGIIPNKSLIVKFPEYIPKEYQSHFIRGYFDGDGSASGGISFVGTLNFVSKIKEIFEEQFFINNTKILKHCKSNVYYYKLSKRKDLKLIYNYLYQNANLFLIRKKEKLYELQNYPK